jgi:hypothetical protein
MKENKNIIWMGEKKPKLPLDEEQTFFSGILSSRLIPLSVAESRVGLNIPSSLLPSMFNNLNCFSMLVVTASTSTMTSVETSIINR